MVSFISETGRERELDEAEVCMSHISVKCLILDKSEFNLFSIYFWDMYKFHRV